MKSLKSQEAFIAAAGKYKSEFTKIYPGFASRRESAISNFHKLGMPSNRLEEWKYSRINSIAGKNWAHDFHRSQQLISQKEKEKAVIPGISGSPVFSINGQLEPSLFSTGKPIITRLSDALKHKALIFEQHLGKYANIESTALTALNTSFFRDGVFIYIPDHTIVEDPIYIVNFTMADENLIVHPRNLYLIGKNSSATIIETHINYQKQNKGGVFTNSVTEIVLEENAHADIYQLQNDEAHDNCLVSSKYIHQKRNSVFTNITFTLNGKFVRNNVNAAMAGEGSECLLYGFYHTRHHQQVDNHTFIDHKVPNCRSNELYAGILDGQSSGIFNGKIMVRKDAQKTNAFQVNRNIIISDGAAMNTKPELEIYADDVKCSHGATTGQVDKDALFYLRSRGIPLAKARSMLLLGFTDEVINKIKQDSLKGEIRKLLSARFEG